MDALRGEYVYTATGRQRPVFLQPDCRVARFAAVHGPDDALRVEDDGLAAGFVFGQPDHGVAFFDVVCRTEAQGLWASAGVLRALFRLAFDSMGLHCVWVQPQGRRAMKTALQAGFVPATPLDAPNPVLVMTPALLPRRLRK